MHLTMKHLYLIISLVIISSCISHAQQFQGGVAAGLIGSQVAGDTYSGFDKLGGYASFWVRLNLNDNASIQSEISYMGKGSHHIPPKDDPDPHYYLMRLDYVEMPFLYQWHLKNKITFELGPSFSYILHSYEELDKMEVSYGNFSLINPSLMGGVGYPINDRLSVNFRFDNSILSIRTDPVNGARHRLFDNGQYNDLLLLFLSYRL